MHIPGYRGGSFQRYDGNDHETTESMRTGDPPAPTLPRVGIRGVGRRLPRRRGRRSAGERLSAPGSRRRRAGRSIVGRTRDRLVRERVVAVERRPRALARAT